MVDVNVNYYIRSMTYLSKSYLHRIRSVKWGVIGHRSSTSATGLLTALAFIAVAAEECDGLGLREVTRIDEHDSQVMV